MKVFPPVQGPEGFSGYQMAFVWALTIINLDMTESKAISDIVVSSESIRVRSGDSSQSISGLLSGTVDVAVAKGVVLSLILRVELGGGNGRNSSTDFSNNWSSSDSMDSNNSMDSRSNNNADSRGSNNRRSCNSANSRSSNNGSSSYSAVSTKSWGSIATGISIWIAKSS